MLRQQGIQRIEVIVRKEGGVGSGIVGAKEQNEDEKGSGRTWRTSVFGSERPEKIRRVVKTNLFHALGVAKQIGGLALEYYVGGQGYATGDEAYQDKVSRQVEILEDYTNFASSVVMGGLYGAWGGPIGAVLGVSMGALTSSASIGTKYARRQRDYTFKVFKQNNSIEYLRARASINLTNGRLR